MKSPEQIRAAMRGIESVANKPGPEEFTEHERTCAKAMADLLHWILDEDSHFGTTFDDILTNAQLAREQLRSKKRFDDN